MEDYFSKIKILISFLDVLKAGRNRDFHSLYGPVRNFEKKFAAYLEAPHALGVASGTDALILALKACGIKSGDEVIVPALGVISSASAVSWVGAKPVFVDIEPRSFNIDPQKIEKAVTSRTRAVIAVHLNGRMADMRAIRVVASHKSLIVIEDAAHAFGSRYFGKPPGFYGDMACFSFNPTKVFGGYGDGGAIITGNERYAEKISSLRLYGSRYPELGIEHPIIGTASRLHPFQAAALNIKFQTVNRVIEETRRNHFLYSELLRGIGDILLPENTEEYFTNGYRFPILTGKRDGLRNFLKESGVDARMQYGVPLPYFKAFHYLKHKKGDFPVAESVAENVLCLPTNSPLSLKDVRKISGLVRRFCG